MTVPGTPPIRSVNHAAQLPGSVLRHGIEGVTVESDEKLRPVVDRGERNPMIPRDRGLLALGPVLPAGSAMGDLLLEERRTGPLGDTATDRQDERVTVTA
ncbi:hypothetical protein AB0A94_11820 [Streptomyces sp. NPDC044984]|uniref:hypothetical protein n=1 Tax=Streptomyces sp. NPDC044984 TaxID=3154335 RepID=UPI0033D1D349